MKANPWIFPVLAALVTGGWIISQKKSASALEEKITQLNDRIQLDSTRSESDSGKSSRNMLDGKNGKKIDWKSYGAKFEKMSNGSMPDQIAILRLHAALSEMSAGELCKQLDELEKSDLGEEIRRMLESSIYGALIELDPKMVLDRLGDQFDKRNSIWSIGSALGKWATQEPAAAAAWLDAKIAEGKLESKILGGRSYERIALEAALLPSLLESSPDAALTRILALPEDEREKLFQRSSYSLLLKNGNDAAYAKLVRSSLTDEKTTRMFAQVASNLASRDEGLGRVDSFISSVQTNDAEKLAMVKGVTENSGFPGENFKTQAEKFEKKRTWAAGYFPEKSNELTGNMLARSLIWDDNDKNFDKVAALALQYNESEANDEVLITFLKSSYIRRQEHKEQVQALLEKIKDPAIREQTKNLPQFKK